MDQEATPNHDGQPPAHPRYYNPSSHRRAPRSARTSLLVENVASKNPLEHLAGQKPRGHPQEKNVTKYVKDQNLEPDLPRPPRRMKQKIGTRYGW